MVQKEVVGRGVRDQRVCSAMREVPRHLFVPADQRKSAYLDGALPIGNGQTITSPYVVAFMTEKLEPQATDKVLEIGTGSGYQASVLSRLVAEVYTIEIVEPLGQRAARTIQRLGYRQRPRQDRRRLSRLAGTRALRQDHCHLLAGGHSSQLVDQLREGGRLVVPLGERFQQNLYLFRKTNGQLQKEKLESTFFVPMTGKAEELRLTKDDSGIPQPVNASFEETGAGDWRTTAGSTSDRPRWCPTARHRMAVTAWCSPTTCQGRTPMPCRQSGWTAASSRAWRCRCTGGRGGSSDQQNKTRQPRVELTFYDEDRALIRTLTLGPWDGDSPWSRRDPGNRRAWPVAVRRDRGRHVRCDGRVCRR